MNPKNTLNDNPFFEAMEKTAREWEDARQKRLEEKWEILIKYGSDSLELKSWYEREKEYSFPYTRGQNKAYQTWCSSILKGSSELECDNLPWENELADFVDTLRSAGFTTLVVTDQSTALMRSLFALTAVNCRLVGLCWVTRHTTLWGEEDPYRAEGIRFQL